MNRYEKQIRNLRGRIVREPLGAVPVTLTQEQLNAAENEIGHPFPEDYREFLTNYGGCTTYATFPIQSQTYKGGDTGGISLFYGLLPLEPRYPGKEFVPLFDPTFDLLSNHRSFYDFKPPELLCIGSDDGNNQICLAIAGSNRGAVYLWDRLEGHQAADYTNIPFISNSFDEFMDLLQPE